MRKITKRSAAIGAASLLAVGAGAAAWAAGWGVTGAGTASASTSAIKPLSATAELNGNVYPGKVTTATIKVTNTNDFPVNLTGVTPGTFSATKKVGAGSPNPACAATLTASSVTMDLSGTHKVDGEGAVTTFDVPVMVSDSLDASCAGSAITMAFTFAGTSTV